MMRLMVKLTVTAALAVISVVASAQTHAATPPVSNTVARTPTTAPEIDARFTTEGALLLMGGLLVLRGRRSQKAPAIG